MSATNKLRWGILGVANINNRLLPAFAKAPHVDLRAIASRDPARAQAAAKASGIPRAHGSYEALLADPDVDAVYIPLPNHLHAPFTRQAADAGKHVLCEKPLTPTEAEAWPLIDYCKSKDVQLMDGFMWPHHPRTPLLRRTIDQGRIGQVVRVAGAFTFHLPLDPGNIRLRPETAGGSLLDVGCYPVFGLRWAFAAEPVRAWATARFEHGVDLAMSGVVWLADGRVGTFDCGFTTPMRQWLEITGTEGVIRVPQMWIPDARAAFAIERDGREPEVIETPGHDQIVCMLEDFSLAVLENRPVRPEPREAALTLCLLDALGRSAREGRAVDVASAQ
jgi:predicted dehydrogenase